MNLVMFFKIDEKMGMWGEVALHSKHSLIFVQNFLKRPSNNTANFDKSVKSYQILKADNNIFTGPDEDFGIKNYSVFFRYLFIKCSLS